MTEEKKRIGKHFGIFLLLMLFLTLLSRGSYASGLPRVTVQMPKKTSLTHEVEAEGNVMQGRQLAVNVPEGLRVEEVLVRPGDRAESGTVLLILDTEYLKGLVSKKELEIEKLRLENATLSYNVSLADEQKNREMERANEDMLIAMEESERLLARAQEEEALARARLDAHLADRKSRTSDEERARQREEYKSWESSLAAAAQETAGAQGQAAKLKEEEAALEKEVAALKELLEAEGTGEDEADAAGEESGADSPEEPEGSEEAGGVEGPDEAGGVEGPGKSGGVDSPDASDGGMEEGALTGPESSLPPSAADGIQAQLTIKEAALAQVRTDLEKALAAADSVRAEEAGLQDSARTLPDFTAEDAGLEAWEEEREALEEQVRQAERATQDAKAQKEALLLEAARRQEDSMLPQRTDASLGISRLELAQKEEELKQLSGLLEEEGRICADMPGVITQVCISPGQLTGSGAALIYADTGEPLQFAAVLDKEQKKYVEQGMDAWIELGSSGKEKLDVQVDYLTADESGSGSYMVYIELPQGTGVIGRSGLFCLRVQSGLYEQCIPLEALRQDENGRPFVFVLKEQATILGSELSVQKINVEVLDRNDSFAAISSAAIDAGTQIIVTSTKELKEGAAVRLSD